MEQTFTYQEETVTVLTDWRFPCVTQSDNSLALMTVLREVGTVLSTMCFLCPDTLSMESVNKKDQTDSMIKISQSVLELHVDKNRKFLKSKFLRFSLRYLHYYYRKMQEQLQSCHFFTFFKVLERACQPLILILVL